MTLEERQALRDKHFLWKDKECNFDGEHYPCDTIKVLDAWEASLICDHMTIFNGMPKRWWFYCPKCDETLQA